MAGSVKRGVERVVNQSSRGSVQAAPTSSIPRIQYSSGSARALAQFSNDLFAVSSRMETQLDRQAEAEGTVEGSADGASGNFKLDDYTTIRGRAYNQAGIQSSVLTMETNAIVKQAELERLHRNDPAGLQTALQNYHNGVAGEIDKFSPGAGAVYRQKQTIRGLSSIERARDNVFKLSQDQAEAALISNRAAIQEELRLNGKDLFSDNPKRSEAAVRSIGLIQKQVMNIYDAVDPATGKPLYSEAQKALAKTKFYDEVMTSAATSWFDGQEDKVGAYLKFSGGDFKIKIDQKGLPNQVGSNVEKYLLKGKDASHAKGLKPKFKSSFASMMEAAPPHIQEGMKIFSGHRSVEHQKKLWEAALIKYGSAAKARKWVAPPGGSQHNHGTASDLMYNGVRLDKADPAVKEWVHENAPKHGLKFRMAHEPWHVEADPDFEIEDRTNSVDILKAISPAARNKIESEMRARISFQNTISDRKRVQEEREEKDAQADNYFTAVDRMLTPEGELSKIGQTPLTVEDVRASVEADLLDPVAGRALISAISKGSSDVTNTTIEKELVAKMFSGEDVQTDILRNRENLSAADFRTLLARNRQLSGKSTDGEFNKDQKYYHDRLKDVLSPDNLLGSSDDGAEMRRFNALDEYRKRVQEGEAADVVSRDIEERANREIGLGLKMKINRLILPRYAVTQTGGMIDVRQSAARLAAAYKKKLLPREAYRRQQRLILDWDNAQRELNGTK